MTKKIKILCLTLGLAVCLIMTLMAKTEISKTENETSNRAMEIPSGMTQLIVHTGTKWVIETTSKLLKPIQ